MMRPAQLSRKPIDVPCVAPRAQHLKKCAAPFWGADVLNGGPPGTDHDFEVFDQSFGLAFQPWRVWVNSQREIHPPFCRPLFRCAGKRNLPVDVSVHGAPLWHWGVVVNDDFRLWIQPL